MKKMDVSVFLGRPLRADYSQASEPAWLSRAVNILLNVEDNYLVLLNIDLRNQSEERYALLTGETLEINSRYSRELEAQLLVPKEKLQRARYALVVDSIFLKNVPIDNVLLGVMVMTIPLSRIPQLVEVVGTMFDPEMTVTHRESPLKRVIFCNALDHLACEGLITRLSEIEQKTPTTALRTVVFNAAINLARAIENAQRIMRNKLNTASLFVTTPGFNR